MRPVLWALFLLASVAWMPVQSIAQEPSYKALIEGAKAEGQLTLWISTPVNPATHAAVIEAFNKRFGLSVKYEWLPIHPTRSLPRLATEAKSGHVPADVLGSFTYDDMLVIKNAGLLKPYPWVKVFGKELPNIKEPADRVIPEVKGLGLAYFDQVFLLIWNTDQIKEPGLPHRLTDLADPKWKGHFVTNAVFGLPLDTLSIEIGHDGALALARKLLDNGPLLKRGSPAVGQAVVSGEAPVGIGTFLDGNRSKKQGQPLNFRAFDDYVPVMPLHVIVPEGAPHPNTARLFAAWLVTEGVAIVDKMEASGRITDPQTDMVKLVNSRPPSSKLVIPKDAAQVEDILKIRRELNLMFTGR
jgi:iron(III) transport system substrate-binding protein